MSGYARPSNFHCHGDLARAQSDIIKAAIPPVSARIPAGLLSDRHKQLEVGKGNAMFTRRVFAACGICSALGLVATRVDAQSQPATSGGIKRTILSREDAPDSKYETVQMIVEVDSGVEVPRHTHPGTESTTLLAGQAELYVKGQADKTMTPGNMYLIPASVPHGVRKVTVPLKLAITYVVEKGKPIASPAPE